MNIHEHPNTKEYMAHFLLSLRKHTVFTDETVFEVESHDDGLAEQDLTLLK